MYLQNRQTAQLNVSIVSFLVILLVKMFSFGPFHDKHTDFVVSISSMYMKNRKYVFILHLHTEPTNVYYFATLRHFTSPVIIKVPIHLFNNFYITRNISANLNIDKSIECSFVCKRFFNLYKIISSEFSEKLRA